MNESNALLAEQFHQNDENAFAKLVQRHHELVFRVCLRILGHRQDAEDATQETFSRVARYLHRWDPDRPLEPWLVTIAGNRSRSLLAKKKSHQPFALVADPPCEQVCQDQAAETLREELDLALTQLPSCQRRAFELFHHRSLSYAEIAAEMDCPEGTAKTWVHRARGSIIRRLQQREVFAASQAVRSQAARREAAS
ncbi:MAG: RNA polymerase sigma factor [Planctomycetota bacterium]